MKPQLMIAITLIVLGLLAMVYQGITYTSKEKVLDVGPIELTTEQTRTFPIPLIAGVVVLAGGIILLVHSRRRA